MRRRRVTAAKVKVKVKDIISGAGKGKGQSTLRKKKKKNKNKNNFVDCDDACRTWHLLLVTFFDDNHGMHHRKRNLSVIITQQLGLALQEMLFHEERVCRTILGLA